jgi:pyruvate dehydrogenase E2 component (dihydrolipoamide acetyltransferase)
VPDIGADSADVVEILVAPGDRVELEQGLVVLESDKASLEVPSTAAGVVIEVLLGEGAQAAEGAAVAVIETQDEAAAADEPAAAADGADAAPQQDAGQTAGESAGKAGKKAEPDAARDAAQDETGSAAATDTVADTETGAGGTAPAAAERPAPAHAPAATVVTDSGPAAAAQEPLPGQAGASPSADVYAGPAVRKLAREFGVPLAEVKASGPRGRVLKEDLHRYVQQRLTQAPAHRVSGAGIPQVPEIDFGAFGPVRVEPRSKLDRLTADNMQRSWLNVPHVTQFDDADITELEAFRRSLREEGEARGVRMTPMPFLIKACAVALRRHPKFASSLTQGGEALAFKEYVHIGVAVDTPAGLMVPVVRDADRKTLWDIAAEVADLAGAARERKLRPAQMQGGCFTVSSLGAIGGRGFTPIVNTPEVGILGVGRAAVQPVWNGEAFAPRTLLPLALSYDHRVINGGDGGRFMATLVALLSDVRRLLL